MIGLNDWIVEPKFIKEHFGMGPRLAGSAAFKTRSATAAGYSLSRLAMFNAFALKI